MPVRFSQISRTGPVSSTKSRALIALLLDTYATLFVSRAFVISLENPP